MLAVGVGTYIVPASLLAQEQASPPVAMEPEPLVREAVSHNPLVSAAKTDVIAADAEVSSARSQNWPSASATAEARQEGLASQIQINQPLYTFGRIKHDIRRAKAVRGAADATAVQSQYDVALRTINAWESFAAASTRDAVSRLHLQELAEFQAMMRRRVQAGVSARIDQDLVDSRMLQSQVQLEGAVSARQLALARLEQLTGLDFPSSTRMDEGALQRLAQEYSLVGDPIADKEDHLKTHPSVTRARFLADAVDEASKLRKSQRWPGIYARFTKDFGPGANNSRDGLSLALQYSFGAGSFLYDTKAADARAQSQRFQEQAALRLVMESAQAEWQNFLSASNRARSLEAALGGAQAVKASYARQFIAGRKSWLDVLNAVREVEQNELQIADAQASMVASAYRLRLYLGDLPWQAGLTQSE